jgi:hypothetical protein
MCDVCKNWVRTFDEVLISECHPDCDNRKIEVEAKYHIERLICLIEYEASMGDGIPEEYFEAYQNAKFFIGEDIKIQNF